MVAVEGMVMVEVVGVARLVMVTALVAEGMETEADEEVAAAEEGTLSVVASAGTDGAAEDSVPGTAAAEDSAPTAEVSGPDPVRAPALEVAVGWAGMAPLPLPEPAAPPVWVAVTGQTVVYSTTMEVTTCWV